MLEAITFDKKLQFISLVIIDVIQNAILWSSLTI